MTRPTSAASGHAGEVIERLLAEPQFRVEFRRDPVAACRAFGFEILAEELSAGGRAMQTLELLESTSNLAGVLFAVAAEGMSAAELHGLIGASAHPGLPPIAAQGQHAAVARAAGHPRVAPAAAPPSRPVDPSPPPAEAARATPPSGHVPSAAHPGASSSAAVDLAPHPTGAGKFALSGRISWFGGPDDPSATGVPASGIPITHPGIAVYNQHTLGGYWLVTLPGGRQAVLQQTDIGPAPSTGRSIDFTYSALPELGYTEKTFPTDATASAVYLGKTPPSGTGGGSGAAVAGALPGTAMSSRSSRASGSGLASGAVDTSGAGGVGASGGVAQLLSSSQVSMSANVRAWLRSGAADPRLVSVLRAAAARHSIVLGNVESVTDPVAAQAVDIVAVDGQPVGPGNVAARDLATAIAALGPALRPSEVATPWPISSPGFLNDPAHSGRLHLAFLSTPSAQLSVSGNRPATSGAGAAGGGTSAATVNLVAAGHRGHGGRPITVQLRAAAAQPQAAPASAGPNAAPPIDSGAVTDAVSPGGRLKVSAPQLTAGQATFAARLAELTGLDARVISAWELAEESAQAAQSREAQGNFNWLNIAYFDSGRGALASDPAFSDPVTAAEQTARFLKGSWGGASASIRAILAAVGKPPDQQLSAIAASNWASSHYGGGANLRATYNELSDIRVVRA